ncbi:diguanylate cyclase [Marinomonas algarum]|uniref:diguanylate cyclase n=1 Tax=Marinomonas algarum TaxID=2883105 RepID=A0A9X1IJ19_9GAMM|nr:diguanylate cyclase [Marinomonas algarum]MCB5160434.1 diguanylate cyclase [Marinomonas algarum]
MIFKRFVSLLVLFSAIVITITYPIYSQYYKGVQARVLATEEISVVAASQMIQKEMYEQVHLLAALKNSVLLTRYATHFTEENRLALEASFVNVSTNYHRFDQVRFLDNQGHERVRVNFEDGKGVVVPQAELQNKAHRYYFKDTNRFSDHQVYVSRLDLNIEHDQIERPYKPMLRLATPVLDLEGRRAGVLVLNYLAEGMLDNFRYQMSQRVDQQGMLIDRDGYWLSNHERNHEWGSDLGQTEHTFANFYPEAWTTVASSASGTVETAQGVFRFKRIEPFNFSASNHGHFRADHYPLFTPLSISNSDWKLVVFISHDFIKSQSLLYQPLGHLLLALLVLLIIGAAGLVATLITQHQAREKGRQELSNVLHDLYDNAPCGYHSLDSDGCVVRINQTELDWLGYSREEVLGQPFVRFLTAGSQQHFLSLFKELKNKSVLENEVLEIQRKNGTTFYSSSSATSVNKQSGNFAVARASLFDITDRIRLEKKLETLANVDSLTGISNRRYFYEQATVEFQHATSDQKELAIMMFDVDHFKHVNDHYGHDVGDLVLKRLAQEIRHCLTDKDLFARFGGEEFIVLLTEQAEQEVMRVAESIRARVEGLNIETPSDNVQITVSLGVATLTPQDKKLDALIKKSDVALYDAKKQGRNRVVQSVS